MMLGLLLALGNYRPSRAQGIAGQLSPETEVRLHLVDASSSGMSRVGDRVSLRVDADVQDAAGSVLIRGGTPAYEDGDPVEGRGRLGPAGPPEHLGGLYYRRRRPASTAPGQMGRVVGKAARRHGPPRWSSHLSCRSSRRVAT